MKNIEKLSFKSPIENMVSVGSWKVVEPKQIILLIAEVNYTTIHFADGEKMMVATPMKALENRLKNYNFFRTHKSFLINLNFIESFEKNQCLKMTNQSLVNVARRKRTKLLAMIKCNF